MGLFDALTDPLGALGTKFGQPSQQSGARGLGSAGGYQKGASYPRTTVSVRDIFQQVLGRDPTPTEQNTFGAELSSGNLDAMGLSMFLEGSFEARRARVPGLISDYRKGIEGLNRDFTQGQLDRGYSAAESRFRQMGRPFSTGLQNAYAQVGGRVTENLSRAQFGVTSNMLANYYGGFGSIGAQGRQSALGSRARERDFANERERSAAASAEYETYFDRAQGQANRNQWTKFFSGMAGGAFRSMAGGGGRGGQRGGNGGYGFGQGGQWGY